MSKNLSYCTIVIMYVQLTRPYISPQNGLHVYQLCVSTKHDTKSCTLWKQRGLLINTPCCEPVTHSARRKKQARCIHAPIRWAATKGKNGRWCSLDEKEISRQRKMVLYACVNQKLSILFNSVFSISKRICTLLLHQKFKYTHLSSAPAQPNQKS